MRYLAVALLFLATPTLAQGLPCHERTKFLSHLSEKYNESTVALALSSGGNVVELLISPGGKTWTILRTTPDGQTCGVASGYNWETYKLEDPQT